jgi:hypothetical protein
MNQIIRLPIILLFFSHFSNEPKFPALDVRVNNIIKMDSLKDKANSYYSVNIDLINKTDSIVQFWTMTCSWQSNFVYSSELIGLDFDLCDSNFPRMVKLKPNQKKTFKGTLVKESSTKNFNTISYKIGFVFINEKGLYNGPDFSRILTAKINKKQDIIWSNKFELNK